MEGLPPYLSGVGTVGVSATYDLDTAVIEMTVRGPWTRRLAADTYAGVRKCLAEHPTAIIINLHRLTDPHSASAAMWLAAAAAARRLEPPVQLALNIPAARPLAHRLRRMGLAGSVPLYTSTAAARTGVAGPGSPTDRLQMTRLAPELASARAARGLIDVACAAWDLPDLRHPARLVISELAANVVQHAGTEMTVTVWRRRAGLHLTVHDGDPRLPQLAAGHGMRIVDTLSAAWGAAATAGGKAVWATVRSHRLPHRHRTGR